MKTILNNIIKQNKKAFTLLELLLIVAVLSIVAIAAAPYFLNSSQESLSQARKSGFLRAYEHTMTGAQMMITLANNYGGDNWKAGWNMDTHPVVIIKNGVEDNGIGYGDPKEWRGVYPTYRAGEMSRILHYYIHSSLRQFVNNKGVKFTLSADIVGEKQHAVVVVCKACTNNVKEYFGDKLKNGDGNRDGYVGYPIYIGNDRVGSLDEFWNFVKDLDETTTLGQKNDSIAINRWSFVKKQYK